MMSPVISCFSPSDVLHDYENVPEKKTDSRGEYLNVENFHSELFSGHVIFFFSGEPHRKSWFCRLSLSLSQRSCLVVSSVQVKLGLRP